MAGQRFSYDEVRSALGRATIQHILRRGSGPPLLFMWVLGAGLLLTVLSAPLLAALYTAACGVLLIPLIRDGLTDPAIRQGLIRDMIAERFSPARIRDDELRSEVAKSVEALTEMAMKIEEAERAERSVDALRSVFSDSAGLVDLQLESASQAEELERILEFVGDRGGSRGRGSASASHGLDDQDRRLREENVLAVREEAASAREMVDTISSRLETMLLQSFQLERETVDLLRTREAARESHEAVQRLQDVVDARRSASRRLADMLSPEEERYAGDRG